MQDEKLPMQTHGSRPFFQFIDFRTFFLDQHSFHTLSIYKSATLSYSSYHEIRSTTLMFMFQSKVLSYR